MSDNFDGVAKICLAIGYPVRSSKSPSLHTIGYKVLKIEDQFIYLRAAVKPENLEMAIKGVKGLGIRGVSVTMPHKQEVMRYLDEIEKDAKEIGAVNTIVNNDGRLIGYNTDCVGAINALQEKTSLKNKKVAIIGAGGAARAIVYGLTKKEAKVKIFNRSIDKAKELSKEFGCEFGSLDNLKEVSNMDILVNATSVGMNEDISPVNEDLIRENQIIFDAVYSPTETRLLKDAKNKGAEVIYGYEMLLYQGIEQFKLYTGLDAPVKEMRKALEETLNK